ncbi:unnamed protein product [Nippostrongylus brasiliensis]|uniref:Titin n=1 Tax=Nippostrongylus brasiliensis TaxID=27835 RepID=A0A0N4YGX8_NIPBR|nr:unnamed protein product [Nippostrongylus brasiliensis]
MSAADGSEASGAGGDAGTEPKSDEEERYRLKIVVLQEYFDAVALQTIRIRERIYQVKKQCRRLEVMKRVALNMLHQNTGTFDIPPLEIVDEDPAPSFLESVHRQQQVPVEPPRKKSKRPSRIKGDGKLTPEEEERAKQKICSIIDSVYSETAKRMDECERAGTSSMASEKTDDDGYQASTSSAHFNGHSEPLYCAEVKDEESSMTSYSGDQPLDLNQSVPVTTQSITYHNMSTALYDGMVGYGGVSGQEQFEINQFHTPLDEIEPMNVTVETRPYIEGTNEPTSDGQLPVASNAVDYASIPTTSVASSYNENLNPAGVLNYAEMGTAVQPTNFPVISSAETLNYFSKSARRNDEMNRTLVGVDSPTVANDVTDVTQQKDIQPVVKEPSKQVNPSKVSNNGLPPPNFIPYRMITVENPKAIEVITIDSSGDEVAPIKAPPKRRRKYKYVVESVLDNVPYTFRQAESDDDEAVEKQSAPTK